MSQKIQELLEKKAPARSRRPRARDSRDRASEVRRRNLGGAAERADLRGVHPQAVARAGTSRTFRHRGATSSLRKEDPPPPNCSYQRWVPPYAYAWERPVWRSSRSPNRSIRASRISRREASWWFPSTEPCPLGVGVGAVRGRLRRALFPLQLARSGRVTRPECRPRSSRRSSFRAYRRARSRSASRWRLPRSGWPDHATLFDFVPLGYRRLNDGWVAVQRAHADRLRRRNPAAKSAERFAALLTAFESRTVRAVSSTSRSTSRWSSRRRTPSR